LSNRFKQTSSRLTDFGLSFDETLFAHIDFAVTVAAATISQLLHRIVQRRVKLVHGRLGFVAHI
jgi:hypothetical protein